jgi:hypothetical protein
VDLPIRLNTLEGAGELQRKKCNCPAAYRTRMGVPRILAAAENKTLGVLGAKVLLVINGLEVTKTITGAGK